MRFSRAFFPALAMSAALVAACGGGGGGGGGITPPSGGSTPLPVATFPPSITQSTTLGSSPQTLTFAQIASGASGSVTVPATTTGSGSATITVESSLPTGAPVPQSTNLRRPETLGATVTPLLYAVVTPSSAVTFGSTPAFTFTFPTGTLQGDIYVAFFDPTNAAAGWNAVAGPIAATGNTVSLTSQPIVPPIALNANVSYIFAIVENGTPLPTGPSGSGTPLSGPDLGGRGGWGPPAVAQALQFPVQNGYNGAGQTVAVIIDSTILPSDINTFTSYFQIPNTSRTISQIVVDPSASPPGTTDIGEASLDTETIAGLAPGANIIVYEIPDLSDQSIIDGYNRAISDGKASVVNSSFGGCESEDEPNVKTLYDPVFSAGSRLGITFTASAGDTGNVCDDTTTPFTVGASSPASDPHVVGVGGTETASGYKLTSATAWNDVTCGSSGSKQCATGGGVSAVFTPPPFQVGLANASPSFRNVPDVAMPAEDVAVYENGRWGIFAGTSWSAPEYAALTAEIYQYCNFTLSTSPASFNPVALPYRAYAISPSDFIDVTSGNNEFAGTSPFYKALVGFDNVSGLGVPYGEQMEATLCPNRAPLSTPFGLESEARSANLAPARPRTLDITPAIHGLIDQGARAANSTTRIQIVLRPSASVASDEATVVSALQRAGFTIVQRFANHLVVDAEAPAATVDAYFVTSLHNVVQGGYGSRYLPVRTATLPAEIAPYISGISLDNLVTMHVR